MKIKIIKTGETIEREGEAKEKAGKTGGAK